MRLSTFPLSASLVLSACLAGPAFVQPAIAQTAAPSAPKLVPDRDVVGTYLMTTRSGATKTLSIEYSADAGIAKITPQSGASYVLYDPATQDTRIVQPQTEHVIDRPGHASAVARAIQGPLAQAGTKTIAGQPCTIYRKTTSQEGPQGGTDSVCTTADGVILEVDAGGRTLLKAQQIAFQAVPAVDMRVPAGYTVSTQAVGTQAGSTQAGGGQSR